MPLPILTFFLLTIFPPVRLQVSRGASFSRALSGLEAMRSLTYTQRSFSFAVQSAARFFTHKRRTSTQLFFLQIVRLSGLRCGASSNINVICSKTLGYSCERRVVSSEYCLQCINQHNRKQILATIPKSQTSK
jgi:hypothetical protein